MRRGGRRNETHHLQIAQALRQHKSNNHKSNNHKSNNQEAEQWATYPQ